MAHPRRYDIVAWGASGYTGRLVAAELLARFGPGDSGGVRWALGGRSESKLASVSSALGVELPLAIADSSDPESLAALAASTRVVLSTVGPFWRHGSSLVAACVSSGTDYCDVTGEGPWVRSMIDAHDAAAREASLRIVSMCGYDSVPSDLLCRLLQDAVFARTGAYAASVEGLVGPIHGSFSGGTIETMVSMMREAGRDAQLRRRLRDPLVLCPDRDPSQRVPRSDPVSLRQVAGGWTGPFIMGGINGSVIQRTNSLLGLPWGPAFAYRESTWCGRGVSGWIRALGILSLTSGLFAGLIFPPTRWLLRRTILPAPGSGPSAAARARGHFRQRALDPASGTCATISAGFDPGYTATARMLVACGSCLIEDRASLPDICGVLTPGAAFGPLLVPRLEEREFSISVA